MIYRNKIKIWIKDIYELDDFIKTWKSSNIYHLPKHVFLCFFFIYLLFDL